MSQFNVTVRPRADRSATPVALGCVPVAPVAMACTVEATPVAMACNNAAVAMACVNNSETPVALRTAGGSPLGD